MLRRIRRLPSPALVISVIALVVAVGGGSFAIASLNSGKVKKIAKKQANKQIKKKAPGLSVLHATTAGSAAPSGPAGGDLSGTYPNPTVANGAITEAKIAPHTIGATALGTITERTAVSSSIANGASGSATVQCNPGEQFLSGGNDGNTVNGYFVVASRFESPNGWRVFLHNETGSAKTVEAHVYCLQP